MLGLAVSYFARDLGPWVPAPTAFGTLGLLFLVWDRFLWRCRLLAWLHGIPDLNGVWKATVRSIVPLPPRPCEFPIKQTWTGIHITMQTPMTVSASISA